MQKALLINTAIPALAASFCLFMAGNDYVTKMSQQKQERADALAKAMNEPEIAARLTNRQTITAIAFKEAREIFDTLSYQSRYRQLSPLVDRNPVNLLNSEATLISSEDGKPDQSFVSRKTL